MLHIKVMHSSFWLLFTHGISPCSVTLCQPRTIQMPSRSSPLENWSRYL